MAAGLTFLKCKSDHVVPLLRKDFKGFLLHLKFKLLTETRGAEWSRLFCSPTSTQATLHLFTKLGHAGFFRFLEGSQSSSAPALLPMMFSTCNAPPTPPNLSPFTWLAPCRSWALSLKGSCLFPLIPQPTDLSLSWPILTLFLIS